METINYIAYATNAKKQITFYVEKITKTKDKWAQGIVCRYGYLTKYFPNGPRKKGWVRVNFNGLDWFGTSGLIYKEGKKRMKIHNVNENKFQFLPLINEGKAHEYKFWEDIFNLFDKKLTKYDTKKVTDYNKVKNALAHQLFGGKLGELKAGQIALDYDDYRKGQISKDEAIKKVVKFMHKYHKK